MKKQTNKELFKKYFGFQMPSELLKNLYNLNDKKKNKQLVNTIKIRLNDLKNKLKEVSEDEIKIEKPYKIENIVKDILKFNQQIQ